ncbi:MAG TPA: Uma2 family endonuclease [Ktedonobacteraceae bacterium]|jgi:Uma2 family endonuclease|nr:Uma2 family endonuclease [Ktedonobacteraceae bacterium]
MAMSFHDVERLQAFYPNNKIELREGKLIIMSPSDFVSSEIGSRFIVFLSNWVFKHNAGRIADSSAGFRMPNGDLLSPDVSFVSRERLKQAPRSYADVVPELIVEVKSSTDRIRELEQKIALFIQQGVQVSLLIDPDKRTVRVYRANSLRKDAEGEEDVFPISILQNGDTLTIPDLFPGWELPIEQLWTPKYE